MGTHPRSRGRFDWARKDCDIWLFNEAPNLKDEKGNLAYPKADAVIQLHHEAIWKSPKNRSDEGHYEWLKKNKQSVIYMQDVYGDVPKSSKYPLNEILNLTKNISINIAGKEKRFNYFTSSVDYALALTALFQKKGRGYKTVEIWGIELEMESEYQYQRTGFGFWTGYLAALGTKVVLHNSIFDNYMYGYEGDVAIPSEEFETRISDLNKELGQDKNQYNSEANNFLKSFSILLKKDISEEIKNNLIKIVKDGERAGIINGKIKESQRYLEKAKSMESVSGASVFSLGEFDGSRIMYTRQLSQVKENIKNLDLNAEVLLKNLINLKKGSHKRQRAVDEFGNLVAELMNKNMLLFHITGIIQENQYYIDSVKLSFKLAKENK